MRTAKKQQLSQLRRWRVRKKISGTKDRPRMSVCFTNKNIHVQFIDDSAGVTLVAASTTSKATPDRDKLAANAKSAKTLGTLAAQTAQAKAVYEADVAAYRQTVLTAFGQVEDNLAALRILEQEALIQDSAVKDSLKAVALETDQYKAGTVSALDVINTQATALVDEKTAVTILGERMNACVLLIQYLGGGWAVSK